MGIKEMLSTIFYFPLRIICVIKAIWEFLTFKTPIFICHLYSEKNSKIEKDVILYITDFGFRKVKNLKVPRKPGERAVRADLHTEYCVYCNKPTQCWFRREDLD
jgi:hypothetical protein